jgi:hypothetical protein
LIATCPIWFQIGSLMHTCHLIILLYLYKPETYNMFAVYVVLSK